MKTLLLVLALTLTTNTIAQTDTSKIEKRFNDAEYNIDMAGRLMQDAAGGFSQAWFFGFVGSLTTGVLIATVDKTEDGNINPVVFIPGIIGFIGSVWNYFSATADLREAGYYLRKSKKKY
ncbi:MAG: hypothetical protein HOP31_08750 [Ignavibacteria bacterium]|nr:hypothetical protein [Ignavibacteria bacterium]